MNEMACAAADDPDLIEAYLLGDLDEPARETFETHLFTCDRCLTHLKLLESLQIELRKDAQASGAAPATGARSSWWVWAAAAATIVMVVGAGALLRAPAPGMPVVQAPGAAPGAIAPAILALARVDPPRYVALDLRGDEPAPGFAAAMRAYAAGDYPTAANGLRRIRGAGPPDVERDFFLGVSLLMSNDGAAADEAVEPLRRVVDGGDSPYRQLASLYLGKALIRRGDLDGADAEWERTRALPGTHAGDAQDLQKSLRTARGR